LETVASLGKLTYLPQVRNAMTSKDEHEREYAATALGLVGLEDVLPDLETLSHDSVIDVRINVIWAYGSLGGPKAIEALNRMVSDSEPSVRKAARDELEWLKKAA
jgi:HEAT repeat protein